MAVNIEAMHRSMPQAIQHFWKARDTASQAQVKRGKADHGNRSGVTAGKNMDRFVELIHDLIHDNGIPDADIYTKSRVKLTLPGYFRPTKNWDLLVVSKDRLVAAIEFKSQVGPSFGNNFNNRVEEAIGNATDLLTAFREGALGESPRPFLGYFFVLEECPASTRTVSTTSPHFSVLGEFDDASYAQRYEILCRKLVHESLYDAASLILTSKADVKSGNHRTGSELTSPHRFAATLAGHVAAMAVE